MQLPKVKLYPDGKPQAKHEARSLLNKVTLQFWDDWTAICKEYGVDAEQDWKRQRNYLYDLYYRGRGYDRTREVRVDGRKRNGRKPKADLEFSKTWEEYLHQSNNE